MTLLGRHCGKGGDRGNCRRGRVIRVGTTAPDFRTGHPAGPEPDQGGHDHEHDTRSIGTAGR